MGDAEEQLNQTSEVEAADRTTVQIPLDNAH